MPTLTGLTPTQVKLCDSLWACDSLDDVEEFISELPDGLKEQAKALQMLMLIEMCDEEIQTDKHCAQATQILERFM